jgi:hypothetical protein
MSVRAYFSRIRDRLPELGEETTPIHVGHRYRCQITGERFDVTSVGRVVHIERLDAERRPINKVGTDDFRTAVDTGTIVHTDTCPLCAQ